MVAGEDRGEGEGKNHGKDDEFKMLSEILISRIAELANLNMAKAFSGMSLSRYFPTQTMRYRPIYIHAISVSELVGEMRQRMHEPPSGFLVQRQRSFRMSVFLRPFTIGCLVVVEDISDVRV